MRLPLLAQKGPREPWHILRVKSAASNAIDCGWGARGCHTLMGRRAGVSSTRVCQYTQAQAGAGSVGRRTHDKDEQGDEDAAPSDAAASCNEQAERSKGVADDVPPIKGPERLVGVILVVLQPIQQQQIPC